MVSFPHERLSDQMVHVHYPNVEKMWLSGRLEGDQLLDMELYIEKPNATFRVLLSHDKMNEQIAQVYQPGIGKVWLNAKLHDDELLGIKLSQNKLC